MKLLDNHYQRVKQGIHGLQGLAVFVAWVITIAGFTRQGKSGGQVKYFFALVRRTILLSTQYLRRRSLILYFVDQGGCS